MKTKSRFGILAVILLIGSLLAMAATPVSAETVYWSGLTSIKDADGTHWGIIYNIPYSNFGGYKVGGYQTWILKYLWPHSDPQKWTRQSYNAGRQSLLLIPTRYIYLCNCDYWSQIYVYK